MNEHLTPNHLSCTSGAAQWCHWAGVNVCTVTQGVAEHVSLSQESPGQRALLWQREEDLCLAQLSDTLHYLGS